LSVQPRIASGDGIRPETLVAQMAEAGNFTPWEIEMSQVLVGSGKLR